MRTIFNIITWKDVNFVLNKYNRIVGIIEDPEDGVSSLEYYFEESDDLEVIQQEVNKNNIVQIKYNQNIFNVRNFGLSEIELDELDVEDFNIEENF